MEIPTRQRSKAYCKRNQGMVDDEEDKHFKMAKSIPGHELIENLWRELKLKIQKRGPNNITEPKEICVEEWTKITPETCKRLVVNYYKRLEAIINNKGYATEY
ncbi:hypothetical protein FHG87_023649 [Trinorchestia longiramus]|nr:hypothetical protein FHG87_023649 [Trinorchestia longiramus]